VNNSNSNDFGQRLITKGSLNEGQINWKSSKMPSAAWLINSTRFSRETNQYAICN
jgi:hypothetical protein